MAIVSYETEVEAAKFKFKTEEQNDWNEMQQSLLCTVEALKNFRKGNLKSVASSIDAVCNQHLCLEDVKQWTTLMERQLSQTKDQQDHNIDIIKEEENLFERGFSLKVQLVERKSIQDLIRTFLNDKDVIMDDGKNCGGDAATELTSSTNGANHGDVVVKETKFTPPPDVSPDPVIEKMDLIFAKKLENVSIEKYFRAGWSEETQLYGPWLEAKGSFEVFVGDWEYSSDEEGKGFENLWSKEKFPMKRVSIHLIV